MMTLRYCEFKSGYGTEERTVKMAGISKEEVLEVVEYGIVVLDENDTETITLREGGTPNGLENEQLIVDHKVVNPCELCVHRLRKVSGNCRYCHFEARDGFSMNYYEYTDLRDLLREQNAENVSPRVASLRDDPFQAYYSPKEISLDENHLLVKREELSHAAKKAAKTRAFKKSHCSSCAFQDGNGCRRSNASYCNAEYYQHRESVVQDVLPNISDPDRLLLLSNLCGRVLKYEKKRYRVSFVKNEVSGLFILTRDYSPWDTILLPLETILDIEPSWKSLVDDLELLDGYSEDRRHRHAVTLHLLRSNWFNISYIENWRRQHMFWASPNLARDRVDIEIHLSKDTYPYHFKSPQELLRKVNYINL